MLIPPEAEQVLQIPISRCEIKDEDLKTGKEWKIHCQIYISGTKDEGREEREDGN